MQKNPLTKEEEAILGYLVEQFNVALDKHHREVGKSRPRISSMGKNGEGAEVFQIIFPRNDVWIEDFMDRHEVSEDLRDSLRELLVTARFLKFMSI